MLVLSRKKNEALVINDNIFVTVAEITGDKAAFSLTLPEGTSCVGREAGGPPYAERPVDPSRIVLERDQVIAIGETIRVTLVDIRGDKVRLGVDAPTEIPVHRWEVFEAIRRENMEASRIEPKGKKSGSDSAST